MANDTNDQPWANQARLDNRWVPLSAKFSVFLNRHPVCRVSEVLHSLSLQLRCSLRKYDHRRDAELLRTKSVRV